MKKTISLFALALCASIAVNAQDATPQLRTPRPVKPMFGIKAGINSARLEIKDDASAAAGMRNNAKTSLHAGVYYQIPVAAAFRIQPELLYSIQGSKTNGNVPATATQLGNHEEFDFHYIALPVMLQFVTPNGFMVELGPQISFLSSANGDGPDNDSQTNLKDGKYVKKVDFAAVGGVGYTSRIGLGLHAKYSHGFTNVWNNENSPIANASLDARNRVVQVGLHYSFGANK